MSRSSEMYSPHLIRIHPDGTGTAILGGAELTVDEGTTRATRAHLIRLCVTYAEETGARTLIRLEDPEDPAEFIEADPSGAVRPVQMLPSPNEKGDLRQEEPGEHPEQPRRGATRLRLPSLRTAPRRIRTLRPGVTILVVAVVLVLMLVMALVTLYNREGPSRSEAPPVTVHASGTLPQSPPLEWRRDALWSSPALMPEAAKVAVVDGNAVGMVTADRRIALIGADGQTRWSVPLAEGKVLSPLSLTYIDQTRVLAIHVGSRLTWWSVDDPAVTGGVELPSEDTPITWRGDTPLIGIGQDRVGIVQSGKLATVTVPAGAKAVSGWADGHVVAGSSTGWWRLTPSSAPGQATPWETPEDNPDELTVIDGMGAYVVAVKSVGDQVHVVIHVDDGQKITRLFSDVLPGIRAGEALTWRPSSSRSWGILGHAIVDMERASVTDLGTPWTTEHIIADRAMGTLSNQKTIVSPDAPRGLMQPGESFPEEVLGTNAVVRGRDEQGAEHVWLLPPNPDVATIQPSSRPTGG